MDVCLRVRKSACPEWERCLQSSQVKLKRTTTLPPLSPPPPPTFNWWISYSQLESAFSLACVAGGIVWVRD